MKYVKKFTWSDFWAKNFTHKKCVNSNSFNHNETMYIHICLTISNLGHFLVEFNWMCKYPSSFRVKSRFLCVNCVLLRKLCMSKCCFLQKFTQLSREGRDKSEGRGKKNLVSSVHLGSSGKDGTRPKVTPSQKLEANFFGIPLRMSPKNLIFLPLP